MSTDSADRQTKRFASLEDFVADRQAKRVIRKILVANNGERLLLRSVQVVSTRRGTLASFMRRVDSFFFSLPPSLHTLSVSVPF